MKEPLEKEINQLATEIYYAHGKDVDYTLDDWIKKIEALLLVERERVVEVIDERIKYSEECLRTSTETKIVEHHRTYCLSLQDLKQALTVSYE